jgi:hypothetical protein
MVVCKSCGNWNPERTVFCPRCGMHPFEARLINRNLNWRLIIAFGLLLLTLNKSWRLEILDGLVTTLWATLGVWKIK